MNSEIDTEVLLDRATAGDPLARDELLLRHRDRLRRMVSVRIDSQVVARADPSDVVQEALVEASRRLSEYLKGRPIPFYPWLRQIAWERLVRLHDRHIKAQKRTVRREVVWDQRLPDDSVAQLAHCVTLPAESPSAQAFRRELQHRVHNLLSAMAPRDREVLVMWYLERLTVKEIALVLNMTESGVRSRHRRAVMRLTGLLGSPE